MKYLSLFCKEENTKRDWKQKNTNCAGNGLNSQLRTPVKEQCSWEKITHTFTLAKSFKTAWDAEMMTHTNKSVSVSEPDLEKQSWKFY